MNLQRTVLLGAFTAITTGVALALPACGGGGYSSPSAPSGGGSGGATVGATVTLTANGVSDAGPRITVGQRVRFTNNDSRPHTIYTTPHEIHTDCPALNDVGLLQPGQSRESGVLNVRRGCGFHDHNNPDDTRFRGQVLVGIGAGDPTPPPPDY
jgi:plastocyanin